jgi:hypothetical protein
VASPRSRCVVVRAIPVTAWLSLVLAYPLFYLMVCIAVVGYGDSRNWLINLLKGGPSGVLPLGPVQKRLSQCCHMGQSLS